VVHNRDQPEIFQNSLIKRTPKAAFRALNLSIKYSRPFPSDLKTDQEVLQARETVKGGFGILKIPTILHLLLLLLSSSCFARLELTEVDISTTNI